MMLHPVRALQLLLLLLLVHTGSSAVHNNATEAHLLHLDREPEEKPAEEDLNTARTGGRRRTDAADNGPDQNQVGCRELRSTKYISDGQCTSVNPIKELVCAGECLPAHLLPNWIGGTGSNGRYWSRREAQEWRCVIDRTRTQRIQLQCPDGSSRTYKITVVISCKCKRYSRQQNDSGHKDRTTQSAAHRRNPEKAELLDASAGTQSDT
ncbi:sclerostin domain-containing protein 1-like [Cololabis saira]|uniref:sclerostin domain-containing protein 1-like n=1 Tax=Cololabis saira TaxID=129043 RepID=UPI002AD5B378|nr:sclerostin domain-containing protein 1-like [Cololabis saira]